MKLRKKIAKSISSDTISKKNKTIIELRKLIKTKLGKRFISYIALDNKLKEDVC